MNYRSFMEDMSALLRRKKDDAGKRQSLFQDVSPGNVGNVFDIAPSNFPNSYTTEAYGQPVRVLEIAGEDVLGEMICVSIQHERTLDNAELANADIGVDTVEGPLTGIVEFGAGAGISAFEFDINTPVIAPGFVGGKRLLPFRRLNGVLLSLPASSMRVFVRNDANAPYLISSAAGKSLNSNKNSAKVRVHATYGRRPFPHKLTRTFPICYGQGEVAASAPFTANSQITFMIPPYATKVYFPRLPIQSTVLAITFFQSPLKSSSPVGMCSTGDYTIPMGSEGPVEIHPYDSFISITNIGNTQVDNLLAVFELSI